ncbi:hypothetical protein A2774_01305 [Candidatus Roizmanbacteria bacterium RIFCSPHIGHO2_01_FULL_39_12c]|uniref:General secretion pathway GspH domain-containing protein n=1 Tax=Candidatus Roizmanbacteria bacterium RIFCSPHIGHO2_01_FULL_39_12c TaxID=1802031 RepID=A0A1F7GDT6_9BACT|nr:MAG: hypothetical protein A2774_01305 [Candidatus Roizmanbacteria bacterium RIFCSPHIGHO2_01_FULL_39_12c]OGK47511.1 MAG: hypothetical protein A2963_01310 [Candidatus Roizmanbacteria bacterium RIFCSPLOWO2_01_FULL_40_13]
MNNQQPTINNLGYTLIEILIVSSIIVIFSGILLASYNNFTQIKNLEQEVSFLADTLSLAKSKTQAADIELACSGVEEFGGYTVELDSSGYVMKQCCRDAISNNIGNCSAGLQSRQFASRIINLTGTVTIEFFPVSAGASMNTVTLKNEIIEKCSDITVLSSGIISAGNPYPC